MSTSTEIDRVIKGFYCINLSHYCLNTIIVAAEPPGSGPQLLGLIVVIFPCLCGGGGCTKSLILISLHNMLPFELTKDTPYLALSGELWSVFYEYFNRN